MSMDEHELASIRRQLISGNAPTGSLISQIVNQLPPDELNELRRKAADGMIGLELEKLAMSQRFQSSSVELREYIELVKETERNLGNFSSYRVTGEFNTASGKTTIETKKGCYIATAVYGDINHQNVETLRQYRDEVLMKSFKGRLFCRAYYIISPTLAKHFYKGTLSISARKFLNKLCNYINSAQIR